MSHIRIGYSAAIAFLAVLLAVLGFWLWKQRPTPPGPEVFGSVPGFTLTERSGRTFGSPDLQGKAWIADFIFTSCGGPCPAMTAHMAQLQRRYASLKDLMFVSFTVDPDRDTPQVLSRYADYYGASADRWMFLTGKKETIYDLATRGMFLAVRDNPPGQQLADEGAILHSTRFVLVDRELRIRGYYDGNDEDAISRLQADLESLLRQKSL